ncbi:MAG: hypothetical protein Q7T54_01545 [Candidatus Levybacteria bacterium]|nr:hypothetical protein [Candidatus Levybacteria bacterium]
MPDDTSLESSVQPHESKQPAPSVFEVFAKGRTEYPKNIASEIRLELATRAIDHSNQELQDNLSIVRDLIMRIREGYHLFGPTEIFVSSQIYDKKFVEISLGGRGIGKSYYGDTEVPWVFVVPDSGLHKLTQDFIFDMDNGGGIRIDNIRQVENDKEFSAIKFGLVMPVDVPIVSDVNNDDRQRLREIYYKT